MIVILRTKDDLWQIRNIEMTEVSQHRTYRRVCEKKMLVPMSEPLPIEEVSYREYQFKGQTVPLLVEI